MTIRDYKNQTDWEHVKRDYHSDAPIPYDPEDGPYDPNDETAVEAAWAQGTIWRGCPPNQVLIQKDGVPVYPDGAPRIPSLKERAKAS